MLPWEEDTLYIIFPPKTEKYDIPEKLQGANCPCCTPTTVLPMPRKCGGAAGEFPAKQNAPESIRPLGYLMQKLEKR